MTETIPEGRLPHSLWHERCTQRHDWAYRAWGKFIGSLSEGVRGQLAYKEDKHAEAYVVVFGKTQVGKTTLILDLMGVSGEHEKRVSEVLRGGRKEGESATATAMAYRRSPDERWGLELDESGTPKWTGNDDMAKNRLGELRAQMESRQRQTISHCTVHIPAACFGKAVPRQLLRILDLPGDQPANPVEAQHVREMAQRHVPQADLILLVGVINQLEFLKPGNLFLPGIEHWEMNPMRFRIVTTHSFTRKTMEDWVLGKKAPGDEPFGTEAVRKHLMEQSETFKPLSRGARQPNLLFPLEFGGSWAGANEQLRKAAQPVIEELREELLHEINKVSQPLARVRMAVHAQTVIQQWTDAERKKIEEKQREAQKFLEKIEANQKAWQCKLDQDKKSLAVIEEKGLLGSSVLDSARSRQIDALFQCFELPSAPKKSVKAFQKTIWDYIEDLVKKGGSIQYIEIPCSTDQWRNVHIPIDLGDLRECIEKAFSGLLIALDGYWLDGYYIDDSYNRDWSRFRGVCNDAQEKAKKYLEECWNKAKEGYLQKLRAGHEALRKAMDESQVWLEAAKKAISEQQANLRAIDERLRELEKQVACDRAQCRRFWQELDREYLDELKRRRDAMREAHSKGQPTRAFLELLAVCDLRRVRDQLQRDAPSEQQAKADFDEG